MESKIIENYINFCKLSLNGNTNYNKLYESVEIFESFLKSDSKKGWEALIYTLDKVKNDDKILYYILAGPFEDFVNDNFEEFYHRFLSYKKQSILWKISFKSIYYRDNLDKTKVYNLVYM